MTKRNAEPLAPAWTVPPWLPGLLLCLLIACGAWVLGGAAPVIGAPVFAILIGMLIRSTIGMPAWASPGVRYSSKQLLRMAIILLGFGLTLGQVFQTGAQSFSIMAVTLVVCLIAAWLVSRWLGVPGRLGTLIGVGTGICGASAIAAVSPIVDAEDSEIAYSISTIFLFNEVAVFLFPFLGHLLQLGEAGFGIWAGTAINDTSSVVAAAFSYSQEAGNIATIVKLTRSLMIIPICVVLAWWYSRRGAGQGVKLSKVFPWFILGFLGTSLLATIQIVPTAGLQWGATFGRFLMVVALVGVGLETSLKRVVGTGWRPLCLGLTVWVTVAVTSLLVQSVLGAW